MVGMRVFVGNLNFATKVRDLKRFFHDYKSLQHVNLKKGYCFIKFRDELDAENAIDMMNGKELQGACVSVKKARDYTHSKEPTRTEHRLLVENLSRDVTWQKLRDFMRQAGVVTYATAHSKRRNEGLVEFASSADMKNALKMLDNADLKGCRIKLMEDKRDSSSSSSYSSRSRSRSPRMSKLGLSPKKKKSRSESGDKSPERRYRSNSRSYN